VELVLVNQRLKLTFLLIYRQVFLALTIEKYSSFSNFNRPFNPLQIEIFLPLKSLIPFLDEGHSLESPVVLKIFGVEDGKASVTLKIKANGYKAYFSKLTITFQHASILIFLFNSNYKRFTSRF